MRQVAVSGGLGDFCLSRPRLPRLHLLPLEGGGVAAIGPLSDLGAPRWGWPVAHRGQLLQRSPNAVENAVYIFSNVVGPKANHAKAPVFEPFCASLIMRHLRGFGVLSAVHLDDKSLFKAHKIGNEYSNRMLTPETKALDLTATQHLPERPFGIAHILAQGTGSLVGHV